mmetsp:Transcript_25896/g.45991  ORF Transcript_25896/g.45991 Transcript_25896/m.45991 type:complete len:244 (-) Transcript_25896:126-857(-)|eukprot:CAMPEP_0197531528 /NCGR_PEP_ID=MMETSP1318-20131121/36077_1 /TAXON_ID=552666 /ORGANISM="Partenskyella glossopodia, Strain RCC365" /LENGTH=243 /DNA_ID=CAMNT_0043087781 /DNA_START=56 /DNA_END=787 /DNA_ORIENTATION=+
MAFVRANFVISSSDLDPSKLKPLQIVLQECGDTCSRGIRICTNVYKKMFNASPNHELLKKIQQTHQSLFQLSSMFPYILKSVRHEYIQSQKRRIAVLDAKLLVNLMLEVVQACWACSSVSWSSLVHATHAGFSESTWVRNPFGDVAFTKLAHESHHYFRSICEKFTFVCRDLVIECHMARRKTVQSSVWNRKQGMDLSKIVEGTEKQLSALQKDLSKLNIAGSEVKAYLDGALEAMKHESKRV